ncbi:MAG: ABC transporter permease [Candidatus Hodarchaeales archaeon]|jgi:simple sugar transport system permease protein
MSSQSIRERFHERFPRRIIILVAFMAMILLVPLLFEDNIMKTRDITEPTFLSLLINHTIAFTVPIFLAALGGLYAERSGIINLALEGMMLSGAFSAVLFAYYFNNFFLGVLAGICVGAVLGLVHAFICIHLKGDQIISGVAINILALGITSYFYKVVIAEVRAGEIPGIPTINKIMGWERDFGNPPLDYDIPRMVGYILFQQSPLVYLAVLLAILGHYVLYRTVFGLRVRAVGEHPRAADTVGINVYLVRYACVVLSGALAGLAGVYLSMGFLSGTFSGEMSAGRGFIAIAAYIFGNWSVGGTLIAALLFGFFNALQEFLKIQSVYLYLPIPLPGIGEIKLNILSSEFLDMIPYLLTIIVLSRSVRKVRAPSAIGKPYEKE